MKGKKIAGLILIIFGGLHLIFKILDLQGILTFHFWSLWPLTTLALGLFFESIYFINKRKYGVLIPGGILSTIGILHLFEVITNWRFAEYSWPIYILAVFIGFFQVYIVTKEKWALIVSMILSMIFLFQVLIVISMITGFYINFSIIAACLTIIIGFILLLTSSQK